MIWYKKALYLTAQFIPVMFSFFLKPYNLLLVAAFVLLTAVVATFGKSLDIHIHDTYIVTSYSFILIPITIFMVILWLVYKKTDPFMYSRLLSWISVLLILVTFGLAFLTGTIISARYINVSRFYRMTTAIIYTPVAAMLIYLLNLILGIVKGKTQA